MMTEKLLQPRRTGFISPIRRFFPIVTLLILGCINALFAWKYVSRSDNNLLVFTAVSISIICPVLIYSVYLRQNRFVRSLLNSGKTTFVLLSVAVFFSIIFFILVPQESIRVDRFEMIRLFWDNLLSNRCPYCPRSAETNIPGPFPFYFFGAFPFYQAGEIGLFSLTGLFLFAGILIRTRNVKPGIKNTLLLILLTSPAFLFEIICRSTNFLNSTFLLFCCLIIGRAGFNSKKSIILSAALTGLALSTRSIAFLVIALALIYRFKKNVLSWKTVGFSAVSVSVFLATFIPVVLICKSDFLKFNPFAVQASLAPPMLVIITAIISVILVFRARNLPALSSITGYTLLVLVIGYALGFILQKGLEASIFSSAVDISYFSLVIPFLLYGIIPIGTDNSGTTPKHRNSNENLSKPQALSISTQI